MQLSRRLVNFVLRHAEKPLLRRTDNVRFMRWRFLMQARAFFRPPAFTAYLSGPVGRGKNRVPAQWVSVGAMAQDGIILYLHGGGYIFGSAETHRSIIAYLAKASGVSAVLPDYSLAPERPFPAAVEDALSAYQDLLARGYPPARIILGGDSAGGGLMFALLHEICTSGLPRPGAVFAFSPWTDLTLSGDSMHTNADRDPFLPADRALEMRNIYLAGADPCDPRATPLYGTFTGAGPVLIEVGSSEILLDDAKSMARVLRDQNVPVELEIWPDLPHVWVMFQGRLKEADQALADVASFIRKVLARGEPLLSELSHQAK